MIVGFSIIPLGKGESLSEDVAKAVKIIEESGLKCQLGPLPAPPKTEPVLDLTPNLSVQYQSLPFPASVVLQGFSHCRLFV